MEPLLGTLAAVSPIPLALAVAFHIAKLAARARAWHNILRAAYPGERLPFRRVLAAFLAGIGVDAVVPARAGQLVRVGLMRAGLPGSSLPGLVSTVVAESAFDAAVTAVVLAVAVGVGLGPGLPTGAALQHPLAVALAGAGIVLAAAWLGFRCRTRIRSLLRDARQGLAVFARPREYASGVASWQALAWGCRVAAVYWFLVAFHLPASLVAALVVVAVQLVASAVPLTPGGAGPQQVMLVGALSASTAGTVLGFGIGMQAATAISDVVLGAASLLFLTGSLRWRQLGRRIRATHELVGAAPQSVP